jgi:hypothetical protein
MFCYGSWLEICGSWSSDKGQLGRRWSRVEKRLGLRLVTKGRHWRTNKATKWTAWWWSTHMVLGIQELQDGSSSSMPSSMLSMGEDLVDMRRPHGVQGWKLPWDVDPPSSMLYTISMGEIALHYKHQRTVTIPQPSLCPCLSKCLYICLCLQRP